MVHIWKSRQKTQLEPESATKTHLDSLKILRGERPPYTLHVVAEQQVETGTYDRRLSQASGLPVLNQVVSRAAVLPDAVRDERNKKIIRPGAVEVFGADNQGRALFPPPGGV